MAPGTVGSLVTLVALWVIPFNQPALLGTLIAVTALGIWAGSRVERVLGTKDPGVIVIDEVAGMVLSVLTLPRTVPVLLTAFVLFRLFDVWKPFPARESQYAGRPDRRRLCADPHRGRARPLRATPMSEVREGQASISHQFVADVSRMSRNV